MFLCLEIWIKYLVRNYMSIWETISTFDLYLANHIKRDENITPSLFRTDLSLTALKFCIITLTVSYDCTTSPSYLQIFLPAPWSLSLSLPYFPAILLLNAFIIIIYLVLKSLDTIWALWYLLFPILEGQTIGERFKRVEKIYHWCVRVRCFHLIHLHQW